MKEISINEKKSIMLLMMDEIDSFCRHNGITYFLVGGTLLGAVRHSGFIPWDDDMDIGMPREDYEFFLERFVSSSGNVSVISNSNSDNYIWASAKAIDNRTLLIEQNNYKNPIGVFIDVFPFDYIDGTYETAIKRVKKNELFQYLLAMKHMEIKEGRSIVKNLGIVLCKLLFLIPDKVLIQRINSNSRFNKSKDYNFICNFTGAWGVREISKIENFRKTVDVLFEGRKYLAPVGYDDYLTTVYGDYMTPPPTHKQITHHDNKAYWKEQI